MDTSILNSRPPAARTIHPLLVSSIVATAFFMENFDATVIVTALPHMALAFGSTPVSLGLGLTSYILALAVTLPASGWLSDRWGARNVFCAAIAGFTLASVLCGLANSLPGFVAMRALQGVAGALMSPVGRLVVLRATDKKDLVRAMNFISTPGLIGPILGPPIGGFIATYADWRWIFFLNLPMGLLGFWLVRRFIPDVREAGAQPFDAKGFGLNAVALVTLLPGLDLLGHPGGDKFAGAVLAAAGVAAGWAAVAHYRRAETPLIDLAALRIKTFAVASLTGGSLFRMSIAAPVFVLPLFLQVGLGHSAFIAGLLVLAHAGGDLGVKIVTTATLKRFGFRAVLIASSASFAALIAGLALVDERTSVEVILLILLVSGIVRSLQMTALSSMQFADVPRSQMTGASTFAAINQNVTRALGIAFSAFALNAATEWRGSGAAPTIADFHVAFVAVALLSFGATLRYLTLPRNAGLHVSAGRGG